MQKATILMSGKQTEAKQVLAKTSAIIPKVASSAVEAENASSLLRREVGS